jgi:hypothetical protein
MWEGPQSRDLLPYLGSLALGFRHNRPRKVAALRPLLH